MSAADPTQGIAAYLVEALDTITAPTFEEGGTIAEGLRILRPELPASQQSYMPTRTVVVLPDPSGGTGSVYGRTDLPVWDSRLAIYCYGSTRLDSQNLSREVELALRGLKVSIWEGVKLYWARHEGGAYGMEATEDPNTLWPVAVLFFQVMHDMESH